MDLLSTTIRLRARHSAFNLPFSGRQVQAWFLREAARHDSDTAARMHEDEPGHSESGTLPRPYTVSGLFKGEAVPASLRAGDWCWLRITTLTQELSEWAAGVVLPNLLPVARIGAVEFDVQPWKADAEQAPWTSQNTYAGLIRQAVDSEERYLTMVFASPTSFSKSFRQSRVKIDVPLPLPDMVFGSYFNHWRAYSGAELPEQLGEFIAECLLVNNLKIQSERVQLSPNDARQAVTGFVGQVCYQMVGNPSKSRFGRDWGHYANIVRMLALFSTYCGTGRKTAIGLGQTRLLPFSTPRLPAQRDQR